MLAAVLMAAAAPSPERAEITINIDLNSDNDATRNFNAPLENPVLDTEGHAGSGPNLNEPQYNLHHNFSLFASVIAPPKNKRPDCPKPQSPDIIVGYPRGVQFAEFGIANSNFTLCRGKVLYDNSVFTVGPERNPNYVYLGSSDRAQIFKAEKVIGKGGQPDKLYLRFTNPKLWFASLNCPPGLGDRVAALEGTAGKCSLILHSSYFFPFLFFPFLSCLSPLPVRTETPRMIYADCSGDLPSIEANAYTLQLEIRELPPIRHTTILADDNDDTKSEEQQPTRELV